MLIEHCEAVGRDEQTIERSIDVGVPTIRDSRAQAFRDKDALFAAQDNETWKNQPTGTPEDVYEWLAATSSWATTTSSSTGRRRMTRRSMVRLATEVRPRLEALVSA